MSVHRHPASARHVNDEKDEGDQEQHPRDLARDGRDSEQSEGPRDQAGNIPWPGVSTFFGSYFAFAACTIGHTGP